MKINYLLILTGILIFSSCNVGVKKDLLSGLKMSNNGLSYDEAYLIMDSTKLNSNEFPLGKVIYLYIGGVKGYTLKENKVYIGGSLVITDENGGIMLENKDLYAYYDETGISLEDSQYLTLMLTVAEPIKAGNKYTWKSKIWDKNGKGTILAELEFLVK